MKNDYIRGGPDPSSGGYGAGGYGYGYGGGNYGYGNYDSGAYEQGSQRSIKDYMLIFRERIWWLIVAFFIIFSGAILYTFNKTKVYTAVAQVRMLRDDPTPISQMDGNSLADANMIRGAEDLNTQISLLESLKVIKGVEQRLSENELKRFMLPYEGGFAGALTPSEILIRNRKIIPRRMSLMINVAYSHPDPELAARLANLFAEEFINYNVSENIDEGMGKVEGLRIKVDQQKERVEELELKLAEYRERHDAVSLSADENIAREELVRLNEIKTLSKNSFDLIETQWNLIETFKREGRDLWELSFIADQSQVATLLQHISSTKIDISALSKRYREKHPAMIQLVQTLQETEIELAASVENAVNKLEASYVEAKSNFELASKRLAEKSSEQIALSKTRVEYNTLLRELSVEQESLQLWEINMIQKKAAIGLTEASARIVDQSVSAREAFFTQHTPQSGCWCLCRLCGWVWSGVLGRIPG